MENNLKRQLTLAQSALAEANRQNSLNLANFALGLVVGAAASVAPEEELDAVFSFARSATEQQTVAAVSSAIQRIYAMVQQHN